MAEMWFKVAQFGQKGRIYFQERSDNGCSVTLATFVTVPLPGRTLSLRDRRPQL